MTENEKAPWNDLSRNDRSRYEAEMLNYRPPQYTESKSDKKKQMLEIMKKDPMAPQLPKGAYAFYASAKREEIQASYPDMPFGDIIKRVSSSWKELQDEERKVSVASWYIML